MSTSLSAILSMRHCGFVGHNMCHDVAFEGPIVDA